MSQLRFHLFDVTAHILSWAGGQTSQSGNHPFSPCWPHPLGCYRLSISTRMVGFCPVRQTQLDLNGVQLAGFLTAWCFQGDQNSNGDSWTDRRGGEKGRCICICKPGLHRDWRRAFMGSAEGIRRAPPPAQPPRTEYSLSFWVLVQFFFFFFGNYYQTAWVWIPDTPLFAVHHIGHYLTSLCFWNFLAEWGQYALTIKWAWEVRVVVKNAGSTASGWVWIPALPLTRCAA